MTDAGVLLAPDLAAIVARANALYAHIGDAAAKKLMQPPTATPSATPTHTTRP